MRQSLSTWPPACSWFPNWESTSLWCLPLCIVWSLPIWNVFSFLHDWSYGTLAFKASTLKVSSENIFERSPLIWFHLCCQFSSIYDDCYFRRRKRGLMCPWHRSDNWQHPKHLQCIFKAPKCAEESKCVIVAGLPLWLGLAWRPVCLANIHR